MYEKVGAEITTEDSAAIVTFRAACISDVEGINLQPEMSWARSVFWLYSILINEDSHRTNRDQLMNKLAEYGIETRPFFKSIHKMPPYKKYVYGETFPIAEQLSMSGINLPSSFQLNEKNIHEISDLIEKFLKSPRSI